VADHVPRCCITLGGEASRRTEGETSSAQGRPASQQQLSVRHLWPDVPVKDRALRPHQDASLVMGSVVYLTAQSRLFYAVLRCLVRGLRMAFMFIYHADHTDWKSPSFTFIYHSACTQRPKKSQRFFCVIRRDTLQSSLSSLDWKWNEFAEVIITLQTCRER